MHHDRDRERGPEHEPEYAQPRGRSSQPGREGSRHGAGEDYGHEDDRWSQQGQGRYGREGERWSQQGSYAGQGGYGVYESGQRSGQPGGYGQGGFGQGGYGGGFGAQSGERWGQQRGQGGYAGGGYGSELTGQWGPQRGQGDYGGYGYGSGYGGYGYGSEMGGQWGQERGFGNPGGYGSYGSEMGGQWREQRGFGGQSGHGGEFGSQGGGRWGQQSFGGQPGFEQQGRSAWQDLESARGPYSGRGPKGYQRSDERIREDVCERLQQHGNVDASEVEVKVERGEVTLSGTVDNRHAKRMAEDAVDSVPGVKEVHNQIRVKQGQHEGSGDGQDYQQRGLEGKRGKTV
jgi:hypothetical protein